jgi:hypothetical protein
MLSAGHDVDAPDAHSRPHGPCRRGGPTPTGRSKAPIRAPTAARRGVDFGSIRNVVSLQPARPIRRSP